MVTHGGSRKRSSRPSTDPNRLHQSNCIVPPTPKASYKDRVFTTNASGFPGWKHIEADKNGHKDFSEVIELAKTCKAPTAIEQGEIVGGFAHAQVFAWQTRLLRLSRVVLSVSLL